MTTNVPDQWLTPKQIRERLKISDSTLRRWANENRVSYITPVSSHRLYNINAILKISSDESAGINQRQEICYCRVSSAKQSNDLVRQKKLMQQQFPSFTIVTDIGSGLNWKRSGFSKLVVDAINGKIKTIAVAHRDRLCRFGFELLELIFSKCGVKLVVLDRSEQSSPSGELAEDLLAIIHVFNCRQMGKRRYSKKSNVESGEDKTTDTTEEQKEEATEN